MTRSEIFKKAHKLAKSFTGNYVARFALALRTIYKELKTTIKTQLQAFMESNKGLFGNGFAVIRNTDKALLVKDWCGITGFTKEIWIPKSQIKFELDNNDQAIAYVAMPEWLAKDKNFNSATYFA